MIKFKPHKISGSSGAIKMTVQKTGRLGFSKAASDFLELEKYRFCQFGENEEEHDDKHLYMMLLEEKGEYTFSISRAGAYYYVRAKQLLGELDIDYRNEDRTIIFDIEKVNADTEKVYRLVQRVIEKKKAK